jgi:hypothetical protein
MMWFIIGLTTVIGPIGILIFYSYIDGGSKVNTIKDDTDDEAVDESKSLLGKQNTQKSNIAT